MNKESSISITWYSEDIVDIAEKINCKISEEDAINILRMLKKNHDATVGINNDTISESIRLYISGKEKNRSVKKQRRF